jgi:hypothetical protein
VNITVNNGKRISSAGETETPLIAMEIAITSIANSNVMPLMIMIGASK